MATPKKKPARALYGSTPGRLLLSVPTDLLEASRRLARAEGITMAEWWRQAAERARAEQDCEP